MNPKSKPSKFHGLSVRAEIAVAAAGFRSMKEIAKAKLSDLARSPQIDMKTLREICAALGMDQPKTLKDAMKVQ